MIETDHTSTFDFCLGWETVKKQQLGSISAISRVFTVYCCGCDCLHQYKTLNIVLSKSLSAVMVVLPKLSLPSLQPPPCSRHVFLEVTVWSIWIVNFFAIALHRGVRSFELGPGDAKTPPLQVQLNLDLNQTRFAETHALCVQRYCIRTLSCTRADSISG